MKRLLSAILIILSSYVTFGQIISTPSQCSGITITAITPTSFKVSWTPGSGSGVMVVVKPQVASRIVPSNAAFSSYSANTVYGSGTNLGGSNFVVFRGAASSGYVVVTGLVSNYNYEAIAYSYEFGTTATFPSTTYGYLVNNSYSANNSEVHYTLAVQPTVTPTITLTGTPAATSASFGFNGSSTYGLVYVYPYSTSSYHYPVDGTYYGPSTIYGNGNQIGGAGTNNFAVYNGVANSSVNVTNLAPATAYYAFVYSYNGSGTTTNNGYNYYTNFDYVYFTTFNNPPTMNALSNYTVCQNAATTVVNLSGLGDGSATETQTTSLSAYSSNTTLLPNPTITYTNPNTTGTLLFKPNPGQSGTAVVTVNVNDGAPSNNYITKTFTVTVLGIPANAGAITTANTTICQQKTGVVFSVPAIANATTYQWTLPSGSTVTAGANTNAITVNFNTSLTSGVVSVYGANTNGCGNGISTSLNVNFDKAPTVSDAGLNQQICNNLTALTANAPTIGTGAWSYCSTGLGSISSTTTPNANLQVTNNTTVTSVWSISNGVCPVSSSTVVVANIFGSPSCNPNADFLAGNTTPCVGSPVVFYNTSIGATSSSWSFGAGATPSVSTASGSVSVTYSTVGPKTVTLSITSLSGPDTEVKPAYLNVISAPSAPGTILGNTSICQGKAAEPYFINTILNATGYTWSFPSGVNQNTGTNTNAITANFSTTATSGNVGVAAVNACGSSPVTTLSITVNPLPTMASAITGSITVCQGVSAVYVATSLNNSLSYTWDVPVGANITAGLNTSTVTVDYSNATTSGTISVYGTNGCGDGGTRSKAITINPLPDGAGSITGSVANFVCPLSTNINYSITPVANASSYTWVYPNGYTVASGAATNSIFLNATLNSTNGNVKVVGKNACGNGDTSNVLMVNIAGLPTQQICVVTVDSSSTHNEVIWTKNGVSTIDSFRVYRVQTASLDTLIGTVGYSDLSRLVDATADPNVTSFTYKIAAVDFCGNEGPKSGSHQSIHLQSIYSANPQKTDLSWNLYSGATVNNYRVLRDTNNSGNWVVLINNLAPNATSYTDFGIPAGALSVQYRVDVVWANSCDPTQRISQSVVNTTKSNTKDFLIISTHPSDVREVEVLNSLSIYPNPTNDLFQVELKAGLQSFDVDIYSQLGSKIGTSHFEYTDKATVDISQLSSGMYFVVIKTQAGSVTKRISKF